MLGLISSYFLLFTFYFLLPTALFLRVHDIAVVLVGRQAWIVNRVCEALSLHEETAAVPLVRRSVKRCWAANLFFVAGDLTRLGLAQEKPVLPEELDDQLAVLDPHVLQAAIAPITRTKIPDQLRLPVLPFVNVNQLRDRVARRLDFQDDDRLVLSVSGDVEILSRHMRHPDPTHRSGLGLLVILHVVADELRNRYDTAVGKRQIAAVRILPAPRKWI